MSLVGIRVLRGPDWSGEDVDGGDGHLGTVVNVGGLETVDVLWDNGKHSTCRVGQGGKYDLRIFDNGTIGVRHTQFVCSSCSEREIFGMRWQCNQCKDVNLCPVCYVSDKHDIHHEFIRYETPESKGTSVSKRGSAVKCQAMGIFPGATVKRGQDWKWGNQDGGDGERGEVTSIENNTGSSSARNIVRVSWKSSGRTDMYRLGGTDGKMDLQFVEQSRGFHYYRDHLPVCKKETKSNIVKSNTTLQTNSEVLEDGDKVCIMVSSDNLKELQKQHSAFTTGMLNCIGKTGEVKGFAQNGDAMVEFDKLRFRFYPGALKKIHDIDVEDVVRILPDENKVTILQENHGGYLSQMKAYLGKVGQVVKKDADGDVVVKFGRRIFVYNPACCTPAPGESVYEGGNDTDDDVASDEDSSNGLDMSDLSQALLLLMGSLLGNRVVGQVDDTMSVISLYKAISDGDTATARALIRRQPTLVNVTFKGVNPLILSSHEGHREIVSELLAKGADINKTDHLGNTPLIAAIVGKEEAIAKLLIDKGADVKPANNNRRTALHCAAVVDYGDLITRLIQKGCDCNYQDSEGDTALHDAILTGSDKAVVALCCAPALDVTVMNKKGFNTIQFAALKNRKIATEKVMERNKSIVHEKKSDWYTPLHIAAVNDHTDIASILILKGKADVNCKNLNGLTPLHLASHNGHMDATKLLVENKADVNILDDKKCTPLHLLLMGGGKSEDPSQQLLAALFGLSGISEQENKIKIACYLIQHGANVNLKNAIGQTPMDVCSDEAVKRAVNNYILQNQEATSRTLTGADLLTLPCRKCFSRNPDITLLPCQHTCLCRQCAVTVNRCPVCDIFIIHRVAQGPSGGTRLRVSDENCILQ